MAEEEGLSPTALIVIRDSSHPHEDLLIPAMPPFSKRGFYQLGTLNYWDICATECSDTETRKASLSS